MQKKIRSLLYKAPWALLLFYDAAKLFQRGKIS